MKLAQIPYAILWSSALLVTAGGPIAAIGPAGLAGLPDPAGPATPAGTFSSADVTTIKQSVSLPGGGFLSLHISCPTGRVAVAAGHFNDERVVVSSIGPEPADCDSTNDCSDGTHGPPTGWSFEGRNTDTNQHTFEGWVVCSP
jgi:hypothetical protein